MANIRIIKQDETFSPSVDVKANKATAKYAVRQNENAGERYELTSVFDFEKVTQTELIEMAVKGLVVDTQRQWRVAAAVDAAKATSSNPYALVNVRGLIDAPRSRSSAPPVTKAKKLISAMSAAEKAELIKMLQA